MKFVSLLLIVWFFAGCGSTDKNKGPLVKYERQIIEVQDIQQGQSYSGQIVLTNTGDATLKIKGIRTDCACTVSEIDHNEIPPNDSSVIHYKLTPNVQGRFQQTITIENNSINEPKILFLIRSKVII